MFKIKVILFILVLFIGGYLLANPIKPAYFKYGLTTIVKSFKANINGGTFKITNTGTPIDGTIIEIPFGALDKEEILSVGYNDGKLNLRSGKSSDITLVFATNSIISFKKPITLKVQFNPSIKPKTIVGYEIDNRGNLHALDIGIISKNAGIISFYTYKPLMLTWVYVF